MSKKRIIVTGSAGFIGFHVAKAFLSRGDDVVGLDNLNDYYDPNLKQARLDNLNGLKGQPMGQFTFIIGDISEGKFIHNQLNREFDRVINLAAQAGVRKSLQEPQAYVKSNIEGFELCLVVARKIKFLNSFFNSNPIFLIISRDSSSNSLIKILISFLINMFFLRSSFKLFF